MKSFKKAYPDKKKELRKYRNALYDSERVPDNEQLYKALAEFADKN
jgi:hypothetical protein